MPDLSVQAQAELLAKLLNPDRRLVGFNHFELAADQPVPSLSVDVLYPLTENELAIVRMLCG